MVAVKHLFFSSVHCFQRYKPFLFKSYNTVSQHFKKILEKVTQEPNVVKALTKTSVSMELDDVDDMFQQFGDAMQVWMLEKHLCSGFNFHFSRVSWIQREPTAPDCTSYPTRR